jgi:CarD family transcriptional regulator
MFKAGDRVVYPGHGVAEVKRIITKTVGGIEATFYELSLQRGSIILVPTNNQKALRALSSEHHVDDVFALLSQPSKTSYSTELTTNWKQRNTEYQLKIHSGDIKKISEIYKELKHIEKHKELSFCEKSLLLHTELLLVEEIALVKSMREENAVQQLRNCFGYAMRKQPRKTMV